jgi:hypothetical protein
MDRQNRTKLDRHKINRTGLPKRGCEDKAARIRQQGQNIQERTERRELQVQDIRTGQAEYTRLPYQDVQYRTSGQGCQNRVASTGLIR